MNKVARQYLAHSIVGLFSPQVTGAARPRLHEVASITTWCSCFLACAATMTTDQVTRDLLAMLDLSDGRPRANGGLASLAYDLASCKQRGTAMEHIEPKLVSFNYVGTSLDIYNLCQAVDHTHAQCALSFLELTQPSAYSPASATHTNLGLPPPHLLPRSMPLWQ
jgi:hypothetical protein